MTWYHGKEGVVKIGTDAVGELQNFSIKKTFPVTTRRAMGGSSAESKQGIYEWAGEITVLWDPADAGQIGLSVEGDLVFEGYPTGETVGVKLAGNIVVAELGPTVPVDDGIEQAFTFNGSGDLTETTLP